MTGTEKAPAGNGDLLIGFCNILLNALSGKTDVAGTSDTAVCEQQGEQTVQKNDTDEETKEICCGLLGLMTVKDIAQTEPIVTIEANGQKVQITNEMSVTESVSGNNLNASVSSGKATVPADFKQATIQATTASEEVTPEISSAQPVNTELPLRQNQQAAGAEKPVDGNAESGDDVIGITEQEPAVKTITGSRMFTEQTKTVETATENSVFDTGMVNQIKKSAFKGSNDKSGETKGVPVTVKTEAIPDAEKQQVKTKPVTTETVAEKVFKTDGRDGTKLKSDREAENTSDFNLAFLKASSTGKYAVPTETAVGGNENIPDVKTAADPMEVVPQLSKAILSETSKGTSSTFKLKLKPEGLGEVTVDLKNEAGKLRIVIKTEFSSTRELISKGLNSLRNELSANNDKSSFQLTSLTVEQEKNNFSHLFSGGQFSFADNSGSRESAGSERYPDFGSADRSVNTGQSNTGERTVPVKKYKAGLVDFLA